MPVNPRPNSDEIRRRLLNGERQADIARACRATPSAVAGIARRMRLEGLLQLPVEPSAPGKTVPERPPLTPRQARVAELVEQGLDTRAIAKEMGVTVEGVYSLARAGGITLNGSGGRRGIGPDDRARILSLAKAGHGYRGIARQVKWSESVVSRVLKELREAGELPKGQPGWTQLADGVRADVVARLKAGQLPSAIAAHHGINPGTVTEIRKAARADGTLPTAPEPERERSPELVEAMRTLAAKGLSAAAIAAQVGRSRQWVASACAAEGIAIAAAGAVAGPWTEAELEALRAAAPDGIKAVMAALAAVVRVAGARPVQRTHSAINREAQRLGIVIAPRPEERAPEGAGFVFEELPQGGCRFGIGLGPDGRERFCGAPALGGGAPSPQRAPYCAAHGAVAVLRASTVQAGRELAGAGW